jgi:Cof subfamily protein (haloacid dehalogenase superfamily)
MARERCTAYQMAKSDRKIKMVALDLDGTAFDHSKKLSPRLRKAIREADDMGVITVIATGRPVSALPEEVFGVYGLDYAVTEDGARVISLVDRKPIYVNVIEPETAARLFDLLETTKPYTEVFIDGTAYFGQDEYDSIVRGENTTRSVEYVTKTRTPVPDIFEFSRRHIGELEEVVINFLDMSEKIDTVAEIKKIKGLNVTTSWHLNTEICSDSVSKAGGIGELLTKFGVSADELMAVGDSPNDLAMIEYAGVGVAMGNADDIVKESADHVTKSNSEDGAAIAIEKFVLEKY